MGRQFNLILSILALLAFSSFSQKGTRYLQENDPLVGQWLFNQSLTGNAHRAPVLSGIEYIEILAGLEVGMIAKKVDDNNTFHNATYFTAKKDATTLYCEITESYNVKLAGTVFSFKYEYDKNSDVLIIIVSDKKYYYSRDK